MVWSSKPNLPKAPLKETKKCSKKLFYLYAQICFGDTVLV